MKLEKSCNFRFSFVGVKLRENPENQGFPFFWFITPLFCRFRLSRVFQTTEREEIYRLVYELLISCLAARYSAAFVFKSMEIHVEVSNTNGFATRKFISLSVTCPDGPGI